MILLRFPRSWTTLESDMSKDWEDLQHDSARPTNEAQSGLSGAA